MLDNIWEMFLDAKGTSGRPGLGEWRPAKESPFFWEKNVNMKTFLQHWRTLKKFNKFYHTYRKISNWWCTVLQNKNSLYLHEPALLCSPNPCYRPSYPISVQMLFVLISKSSCKEVPQTVAEIDRKLFFPVMEARSLKSRCWQIHAFSESSRRESVACLSPSFWWFPEILGGFHLVEVPL